MVDEVLRLSRISGVIELECDLDCVVDAEGFFDGVFVCTTDDDRFKGEGVWMDEKEWLGLWETVEVGVEERDLERLLEGSGVKCELWDGEAVASWDLVDCCEGWLKGNTKEALGVSLWDMVWLGEKEMVAENDFETENDLEGVDDGRSVGFGVLGKIECEAVAVLVTVLEGVEVILIVSDPDIVLDGVKVGVRCEELVGLCVEDEVWEPVTDGVFERLGNEEGLFDARFEGVFEAEAPWETDAVREAEMVPVGEVAALFEGAELVEGELEAILEGEKEAVLLFVGLDEGKEEGVWELERVEEAVGVLVWMEEGVAEGEEEPDLVWVNDCETVEVGVDTAVLLRLGDTVTLLLNVEDGEAVIDGLWELDREIVELKLGDAVNVADLLWEEDDEKEGLTVTEPDREIVELKLWDDVNEIDALGEEDVEMEGLTVREPESEGDTVKLEEGESETDTLAEDEGATEALEEWDGLTEELGEPVTVFDPLMVEDWEGDIEELKEGETVSDGDTETVTAAVNEIETEILRDELMDGETVRVGEVVDITETLGEMEEALETDIEGEALGVIVIKELLLKVGVLEGVIDMVGVLEGVEEWEADVVGVMERV